MNSVNEHLRDVIERRTVLKGGLALLASTLFGGGAASAENGRSRLGFTPIPASADDAVHVPKGYTARVLTRWGDPVGHRDGAPAFRPDGSNSAADQALQFGMHHDGMAFFSLPAGSNDATHGLLVTNHEYMDRGLLHPARPAFEFRPEQVQKEINAHGVSVCEIERVDGRWQVRRPSPYARRITADTRIAISGPARGHALMRTAADPRGTTVRGTLSNCSNGRTPWGTYLTCEENWNLYFSLVDRRPTEEQSRYGLGRAPQYDWVKAARGGANFERFDARRHPNEMHRFGWVVEIDPYDPKSEPRKRTALGRIKHENAAVRLGGDGHVAVYMGDDEANEYIYKFVSKGRHDPARPEANRNLLEEGTLHVARFDADGRGTWLPLTPDNPAVKSRGLGDLATVLVYTRMAADAAGGTKMDRPEWIAVDPLSDAVYCSLTNNEGRQAADAANPRPTNVHGHVLRWREEDPAGTSFTWDVFVLAGDPASTQDNLRGNIRGDLFSSPDGLGFDARGVLWIETDMSSTRLWHPRFAAGRGEFERFGNNQMLAVVPSEGVIRRFLTGPVGAEITGFTMAPDGRSLFINVQHPGEPLSGVTFNDPGKPTEWSTWPDGGRPRSATVVITKNDGGLIGE
jgi:secreted PhoX family phosphatase